MNGSASDRSFGFFASCFSPSWENFVHGMREVYLSPSSSRKMTPVSLNVITSPVSDVPSVKGYVSEPTATNNPQSQRLEIVQKILRTKKLLTNTGKARKQNQQ
jgi:hypothetical protein